MNRPRLRTLAVVGLTAGAVGSMTVASAAGVTVTPAALTTFSGLGPSGAPTVYAADNFTGANNTSIDGRALATGGGTWDVISGTWRLNGAGGVSGTNSTTSRAVTDAGQADTRTSVTVNDPTGGGRISGLIVRSNAAATQYIRVEQTTDTNPDAVRLVGVTAWGGGETVLASVPFTLTAPATLSVQTVGSTITVAYNGTVLGSYTLNLLEAFFYTGGTYQGVFNRNTGSGNTVTFTDFRVESPT